MRSVRVLLFMLLCAGIGVGQIANSAHAGDRSPSQKSVDALLDRVSGLPAEYKADLGFAIIDSDPSALSPARKKALLDDIFHSAASAHYPYMVLEAAGHPHRDTLPHVTRNMLGRLKLDALDIQTRAIDRALPLTPQFANHLFEELNLAEVRASCKDPNVEDVSAFYATAKKIIEDKRIKTVLKQNKDSYLESLASNVRVPAQIAPLANLITQMPISPVQMGRVESALVSSLSAITASDREMTAAEEGGGLTDAIKSLSAKLTQSGISSVPLLAAYRGFLLRGLTQESCADHSLDRTEMAKGFNALLPSTPPESSDMGPLSGAQLNPKSTGDKASYDVVPFNEQMMAKMQRIVAAHQARFAEEYRTGNPSTIEPEPSNVEDVVKYAISIEPNGAECSVCDFDGKGALFMMLVDILPAGQQLERAINAEADYLSFNAMQNDDPVAWLTLLKYLINESRKPTDKATATLTAQANKGPAMTPWGLPSPEASVIRKSLRRSSDPIISAYMSADYLLHLPYLTLDQQVQAK